MTGKEEKQEIDKIFRSLDMDCDGAVSRKDMETSYKQLGVEMSEDELNSLFAQVNFSGSGKIEYSECAIATMLEKDMVDEYVRVQLNMAREDEIVLFVDSQPIN